MKTAAAAIFFLFAAGCTEVTTGTNSPNTPADPPLKLSARELYDGPQPAMLYPAGYAKERQNQELQCKNGKAANNRHPVAPANGEPSQPCKPQDVSDNGSHDACKDGILARRRGVG